MYLFFYIWLKTCLFKQIKVGHFNRLIHCRSLWWSLQELHIFILISVSECVAWSKSDKSVLTFHIMVDSNPKRPVWKAWIWSIHHHLLQPTLDFQVFFSPPNQNMVFFGWSNIIYIALTPHHKATSQPCGTIRFISGFSCFFSLFFFSFFKQFHWSNKRKQTNKHKTDQPNLYQSKT